MKDRTFETFDKINGYRESQLISKDPSCFNGIVSVRKYRVTIELIDEPMNVIHARLQKMWDECDNSHHWGPLREAAKEYGLELKH